MSSFWDTVEILHEINKNKREKIVVSKCSRQNKEYIDYRIHVEKDGEYVPTSKGYNLEIDKAIELSSIIYNIINK